MNKIKKNKLGLNNFLFIIAILAITSMGDKSILSKEISK